MFSLSNRGNENIKKVQPVVLQITQVFKNKPKQQMPWTPEHIPALTLAHMHTLSDATVALVALSPLQMVTDGT